MLGRFTTTAVVSKHLRSAGVFSGPGTGPERPSIRVEPATVPCTLYRMRSERPARQRRETIHRTNGAFPGHPAAERWLSPTSLGPTPAAILLDRFIP